MNWPPTENTACPCPDTARWFQEQLTAIGGIAHGVPRFRLFWGQEMMERDQYPGSPNFDGGDMMRHRYSVRTLHRGWTVRTAEGEVFYAQIDQPDVGEGDILERVTEDIDVGIPRFYIHGWRAHSQRDAATYDADLTVCDPDTGEMLRFGPTTMTPGQWSSVVHVIVSEPDGRCCSRARMLGTACFHNYREPSQIDLDYIAACWRAKEREPVMFSEGEIAPSSLIEARTQARLDQIADKKQRERAEMRFRINRELKSERHLLFDQPRSGYSVATGHAMPTGKNIR